MFENKTLTIQDVWVHSNSDALNLSDVRRMKFFPKEGTESATLAVVFKDGSNFVYYNETAISFWEAFRGAFRAV